MFFKKKEYDFDRICRFCSNAKILENDAFVLCNRVGIVTCNHTCKKFKYDLLKRIPGKRMKISDDLLQINDEQ